MIVATNMHGDVAGFAFDDGGKNATSHDFLDFLSHIPGSALEQT